jgi:hypothetical protein
MGMMGAAADRPPSEGRAMTKRDELIGKYAGDIRTKVGEEPEMALLRKVTEGLGPSIYNRDSETVSTGSAGEMETVKKNFLIKKLGLEDGAELDAGIEAAIERYGRSNRSKYRAVFYYLLVKHFGKEGVYD